MNIQLKKILLVFVIALLSFFSNYQSSTRQPDITPEATSSGVIRVARVIDGDTIELDSGQKVRYIGIDTPETVDPRRPVACFGHEASEENKRLVQGKMVRLEKDISETDKYGRLLRYVYIGDVFVNDYLVRQGFAHVATFPPDVQFADTFVAAQSEARNAKRGLWSVCDL